MSQCGPGSGRSGSGTCVAHLEKSFFPMGLHSRSHSGFLFVALSFTCTVGLVMEIITCADKAWQRMKGTAIKAPALELPGTPRRDVSVCG